MAQPLPMNRSALARDRAGLSVGQAAKMFNVTKAELEEIEKADSLTDILEPLGILVMCGYYGVSVEWITGVVERYDYAHVDKINGADELSSHDRNIIAEFAASMPRSTRTSQQRLEGIRIRKKQP